MKIAKFLLVPKTGKPYGEPSFYCTTNLLNTVQDIRSYLVDSNEKKQRIWWVIDDKVYLLHWFIGYSIELCTASPTVFNRVQRCSPPSAKTLWWTSKVALVIVTQHLEDVGLYSCESELVEQAAETILHITKRFKSNYVSISIASHMVTLNLADKLQWW